MPKDSTEIKRERTFVRYKLPALIWASLIFIASSIPSAKLPKMALLSFDKLIHVGVFCVFGLLLFRALRGPSISHRKMWVKLAIVLLVVMAYGALDEYHQSFVPGRTEDFFDLLADTIGGLLAVLGTIIFSIRKQTLETQSK